MIFPMKWVLLVMIVGAGGGSVSRIATFDSEEACRMGQSSVAGWVKSISDDYRKNGFPTTYSATINCVEMPVEMTPSAGGYEGSPVSLVPIVPRGSGK